jgi:hypothetical protein
VAAPALVMVFPPRAVPILVLSPLAGLVAPAAPIARPIPRFFFVLRFIWFPRSLPPVSPTFPFPARENRGYGSQLSSPYVRGSRVELAPLLLFGFGQIVQARLGLGGFFRKEGGVVACRFFDDAPEEAGIGLRLV